MNEAMDPLTHTPLDAKTMEVPQQLIQDLFDSKIDNATFAFRLGVFHGERAKLTAETRPGMLHYRFANAEETEAWTGGDHAVDPTRYAVLHVGPDDSADLIVPAEGF